MKLKHILLVVCVVFLVCASAGCIMAEEDGALPDKYIHNYKHGYYHVYVYVDVYTGVEYLIYNDVAGYAGYGGICPRYNPDGTLKINEEFMK